jgi:predicted nucleic acid-binding protein
MKIYADTSFLVSLYVHNDALHHQAKAEVASWSAAPELPITPFGWIEMENTLARLEQRGRLTLKESVAIGKTIKSDIGGGFLRSAPLGAYQWLATARELSRKVTPVTGTRTLDVLHLALVIAERCTHVASFDTNQRRAAAAAGLKLLPATLPAA